MFAKLLVLVGAKWCLLLRLVITPYVVCFSAWRSVCLTDGTHYTAHTTKHSVHGNRHTVLSTLRLVSGCCVLYIVITQCAVYAVVPSCVAVRCVVCVVFHGACSDCLEIFVLHHVYDWCVISVRFVCD